VFNKKAIATKNQAIASNHNYPSRAISSMNTIQKLSMSVVSTCAVMGGLLLSTQASIAAPVRIQNPGFEVGEIPDGGDATMGWSAVNNGGNGGTFTPGSNNYLGAGDSSSSFTSAFGQNVAYSNGRTIEQTLNATFNPDKIYRLSVDVGKRLDVPFPSAGASIQLLAGDTVIATAVTPVPPSGGFLSVVARYSPRLQNLRGRYNRFAGQPLTIRLLSTDGNVFTGQVNWDNVKLQRF
jgi:hypothetical protein